MDIYKCPISFFQSTLGILLCKLYNKWSNQLKENYQPIHLPELYNKWSKQLKDVFKQNDYIPHYILN